jgi:hypothetical protein
MVSNRATSRRPSGSAQTDLHSAHIDVENARLRRELERARAERDILKKAIGIFWDPQ